MRCPFLKFQGLQVSKGFVDKALNECKDGFLSAEEAERVAALLKVYCGVAGKSESSFSAAAAECREKREMECRSRARFWTNAILGQRQHIPTFQQSHFREVSDSRPLVTLHEAGGLVCVVGFVPRVLQQ